MNAFAGRECAEPPGSAGANGFANETGRDGETRRTTGDGSGLGALVSGTQRLSGDQQDARRFCS
jgi:hypothetical protein